MADYPGTKLVGAAVKFKKRIDVCNVSVFGVYQVLEAMEVTHGLLVCCAVFVNFLSFWDSS